jgi:uncharacterized protein (TIGR04255 family)
MRKRYKKPFLNKVIARVDFASPEEALLKKVPPRVNARLLPAFPILEPRKAIAAKLMISGEQLKEERLGPSQTHWWYHGKHRKKRAVITPQHFLVEYDVYESFEELKSHFLPVLEEFFKSIEQLQVKRFGLRYIDHITFDDNNIFEWSDYLHKSLLGGFSVPHEGKQILRAFNNFTVSNKDMVLQFQYGMHNPDFPAPIKKKLFVLDFDAYTQGLLDFSEIQAKLEDFHEAIGKLFEQVITDKLREIMGEVSAD